MRVGRKNKLSPIPAKAGISLFLGQGGQRTHCTEFGAGNARTLESGDSRLRGNGESFIFVSAPSGE